MQDIKTGVLAGRTVAIQAVVLVLLLHNTLPPARASGDCSYLLADIVFLLDESGSVGAGNFGTMKNFIVSFIRKVETHVGPNSIRLASVTYSSSAGVNFYLDQRQSAQEAINGINAIAYTGGYTNTGTALNTAGSVLSTRGARTGVTKLVVLLTDGKSNSPSSTQTAAASLRNSGVRIMAIGVGSGVNTDELHGVASSSSYVYTVSDFSALASIQAQLVSIACEAVCSWHEDHCWPGDCSQYLASNCVCRSGFTATSGSTKKCQLSTAPEILTCRMSLRDAHGNEVRSTTSGTLQHCSNQQHEFMNIQPTTAVYHLKADLHLSVGSLPYYVSSSRVGVVGAKLRMTRVSVTGSETTVKADNLNQPPFCQETVTSTDPATVLDCDHNTTFTLNLIEGDRLCADIEALGGGFYNLQDYSSNSQGQQIFPTITATRRLCFTYDISRPVHCSDPTISTCTGQQPLELSTRLTRSPHIRVSVPGWLDPIPAGGSSSSASQISEYKLEVHGVDVAATFLSVQENAQSRITLTGSPPYSVDLTLPSSEPHLYAVILEVHDHAGNVGYARRLVFYDNSSKVVLDPHHELKVVSANPRSNYLWQTDRGDVCVNWEDRFYNDVFFHHDYLLPVKPDTALAISGRYDQISGILPVSGTPTVRGVDTFELAWSLDGGPQSSWSNVQNVTSQTACLTLPTQDGQTYDVTVRATDVIGNTNSDVIRLHVDHSGPEVQERGLRGRWERDGLYVHGSSDLSEMVVVVEASDPHSGLASIRWTVGTLPLGDDVGTRAVGVQRIDNVTSCGTMRDCYCPVVGTCETYLYNITFNNLVTAKTHEGDHHRDYYVTVNVTNVAGLTFTQEVKVMIDVSRPTAGVAMEGLSDEAEIDFTSQQEVHVRWHGFDDPESDVLLYRVVLAERCLTDQEMDNAENATEVTAGSGTSATFRFPSEGRYFTSVVAYNGALTPSKVACSDGIVYDTTPPRLLNVSIAHARTSRALGCAHAQDDVWLVNSNLTRTKLSNATSCFGLCSVAVSSVSTVDHLPTATPFVLGEQESDDLCRRLPMMTEDSWIALPSDRLVVTWASEDPESEMEEFHVGAGSSRTAADNPDLIPLTSTHVHHAFHAHHSGLGQGAIFFLFIRGLSKAGLQVQLVLGPILVDSTPPEVRRTLQASVDGDVLTASWGNETFVDLEQPASAELEISFRVGHDKSFVTSFLPMEASTVDKCRRQDSSVLGCVHYPLVDLVSHDARAARSFFFQLHVRNAAGHVTAVNTSSATLPSREVKAVVLDVLPAAAESDSGAASDVLRDVDVIVVPDIVCAAWSGSLPADAQVSLGVGTTVDLDDVTSFTTVNGSDGRACVNVTAVPVYTTLFSLVKVNNSDTTAVLASDGLIAVQPQDPDNVLSVFNGRGCREQDVIGSVVVKTGSSDLAVDLTTSSPLHAGDVVFVRLKPFTPQVQFDNAVVLQTATTGYQVIMTESANLSLTLPAVPTADVVIEVQHCLKDSTFLATRDIVTATWEIAGPWSDLATYLQVEVLDRTCLQQSTGPQTQQDRERCLVAEKRVAPKERSVTFLDVETFPLNSYATSVAVCFDDECLPSESSLDVVAIPGPGSVTLFGATLLSQSARDVEVEFKADVELFLPDRTCFYQWSLTRTDDGSKRLVPWRVQQAADCSDIEVKDVVSYTENGHGTLYACVQPLFPWRADTATCSKFARAPVNNQVNPFHVIELSHDVLRVTNLDNVLHSQQLGHKLHDLYDLDLDFARSDLLPSAIVTHSYGREITWFLMREARVPENAGACAADADCVTSEVSDDGTVTFPRDKADLQGRRVYYVCASLAALGLTNDVQNRSAAGYPEAQEVCGDGFVVDDDSPLPGTVVISNANSGYLADRGRVLVTWSGFSDVEKDVTDLPFQTTLNYSVALGSFPGAEDLAKFTSVGQRTAWTFDSVQLASGIFAMATVRAEDHVGHVTEVTSKAVVVDNTPPSEGRVWAGNVMEDGYLSGHELHVRWEGVKDLESGIEVQEVAVSMRGGHDDVIPFRRVRGNWVTINGSVELVDGHSYVVLLKSTNRAGLTTLTSSEPFVADTSPPEGGRVWNGAADSNEHVRYVTDVHVHSVHWGGYHDPHTGLAYYRVGLGTSPGADDIHALQYVGLQTSYTWRRKFDQGKWYYATVEACNHAGLCMTSSSDVMFDNSPPTSGVVIVGGDGHHNRFYGHNTTLPLEWPGFADPQSGVREFWWCVGITSGGCDVTAEKNAYELRGVTAASLSLPVGTPLYVTVRAVNFAGLSTVGVSDSFIVDVTPPDVVVTPHFLSPRDGAPADRQRDRSVLKLTWEFDDPDSSVVSHTLSVRGERQARQAVQQLTMATDSHVTLQFDADELLMDGDLYVATVTACNSAGLCRTANSDPLLVDSTSPNLGKFFSPMAWKIVLTVRSVSTTPDTNGTMSSNSTSAPDTNGTLSSNSTSAPDTNGTLSSSNSTAAQDLTTTTTQPTPVRETQISMSWGQFSDEESGVLHYYATVGRTYSGSELSRGAIQVNHDNSTDVQTLTFTTDELLTAGQLLVFSIQAENAVGLLSPVRRMTFEVLLDSSSGDEGSLVLQRHSCSHHYCTYECTCAPWGQVCDPVGNSTCTELPENDPSLVGVRMTAAIGLPSRNFDFLTSAKCLEGYWTVSDPSFLQNISRFQWSFSLANLSAGMGVFDTRKEPAWQDTGMAMSAAHCLPDPRLLTPGSSYVLHVRAWLSHDTYVTVVSAPVLADHSPPSQRRGGAVIESDGGCMRDVDFVTGQDSVTACWNGVFTDPQTGIDRYEIWVGTSPYGDDHLPRTPVGKDTTFDLDKAAMLDGTRYYVSVRAWNGAGLSTTAVSDGVMKDSTPPTPGVVFAASRHASQHVTNDVTTMSATWHGFQDLQSGVTSYSVALYDASDVTTPVVNFADVGFLTKFTFEGLSLEHGHRYQVAVKAQDAAGLFSTAAMSPSILVDVTPPEGAACNKYKFEGETTLTYTPTSSFRHELYNGSLNVTLPASDQLLKVELSATSLQPGARAVVTVNELKMPLLFQHTRSGDASAHQVFIFPDSGSVQANFHVEGKSGASITASLYTCSNTVVSSSGAVSIRQVSPFAVSVHVTARDPESAIMSLMVGVGSTPGGVQVRPLTPVGHGGHSAFEVAVQHGSPLYAVLAAQNHAGAWSRFISSPITMDTTAPVLSEVTITLTYSAAQPGNTTAVTAEARWTAEDVESGSVTCSCELVGHATTDEKVQVTSDVTPAMCQWQLDQPKNGRRVRVVVACVNKVQILATATSSDAVVLVSPPDLSQMTLASLPNYAQFSPFDSSDPIVRSSNSSLEFLWRGADDPTIVQYEYRFLHKSTPLTGWSPLPNYKTAAMLKHDARLARADAITVEVRAVNSRQMTSEVVSVTSELDDSKPALTGTTATAVKYGLKIYLNWPGVFDAKRDVTYLVYAGSEVEYGDVINHHVTKSTTYEGPCDASLDRIYVTVQAFYVNGLYDTYNDVLVL